MGYPQATMPSTPPPSQQETVTSVLAQALDRLNEIERKLCDIRDRIEVRQLAPEKVANPQQQPGTLHLSMDIRTATMRVMERCAEIDAIL